jgi:hypothetical protein
MRVKFFNKQFDMMKQMRAESRKPMEPVAVPK